MKHTILKFTLPLLLIILIGCTNQPELSTDLQDWEDCRTTAWKQCFGVDNEFADIFNMLCSNYDILNESECIVLNYINTNCWRAQFDLCDKQFDMESIEEQLNGGLNEI